MKTGPKKVNVADTNSRRFSGFASDLTGNCRLSSSQTTPQTTKHQSDRTHSGPKNTHSTATAKPILQFTQIQTASLPLQLVKNLVAFPVSQWFIGSDGDGTCGAPSWFCAFVHQKCTCGSFSSNRAFCQILQEKSKVSPFRTSNY